MLQICKKVYLYRYYRKSSLEQFTAQLSAFTRSSHPWVGRLYADLSGPTISQAEPTNRKASQIPSEFRFALSGPECCPLYPQRVRAQYGASFCRRPLEVINTVKMRVFIVLIATVACSHILTLIIKSYRSSSVDASATELRPQKLSTVHQLNVLYVTSWPISEYKVPFKPKSLWRQR